MIGLNRLQIDPNSIDTIFISHLHGDHFAGLVWWLIHAQHVAKRTKSALKAGRQNVKRREHNRQMRTKLRSSLKAIRASLDAKDLKGAQAALSQTVSIVDKMATKGIIHRNTAGRYKSRLSNRLTKASA